MVFRIEKLKKYFLGFHEISCFKFFLQNYFIFNFDRLRFWRKKLQKMEFFDGPTFLLFFDEILTILKYLRPVSKFLHNFYNLRKFSKFSDFQKIFFQYFEILKKVRLFFFSNFQRKCKIRHCVYKSSLKPRKLFIFEIEQLFFRVLYNTIIVHKRRVSVKMI